MRARVAGLAALGSLAALGAAACVRLVRRPRVRTLAGPDGEAVRALAAGGVFQSATYVGARRFEPVFAYIRAFDAAFLPRGARQGDAADAPVRLLMLGGGGFSWPKHVLTARPAARMDVVEIDVSVIDLARRSFYLGELEERAGARLRIFTEDGRSFLERAAAEGERYDAIVNDAFSGSEPVRALASTGAVRAVRAALAPDGVYLVNVVSRGGGGDLSFLRDEAATLVGVFAHVAVAPCSDDWWGGEDNYLVAASDVPFDLPGSIPFDEEFLGAPIEDGS
ncbi:spermidine synthase [Collinsella phocaeensis]|uniref:spermidine synthase n=1 Tax=Collinsella phocaeensis TaxID=1871016 RepID=UPI00093200A1|nr:fused MFS/spermidine synthase [Collinsella phocaeensis]